MQVTEHLQCIRWWAGGGGHLRGIPGGQNPRGLSLSQGGPFWLLQRHSTPQKGGTIIKTAIGRKILEVLLSKT